VTMAKPLWSHAQGIGRKKNSKETKLLRRLVVVDPDKNFFFQPLLHRAHSRYQKTLEVYIATFRREKE
jgi:hypothetical protein